MFCADVGGVSEALQQLNLAADASVPDNEPADNVADAHGMHWLVHLGLHGCINICFFLCHENTLTALPANF